jgi:hypothetical protein
MRKHVASTTLRVPTWVGTTVLSGPVARHSMDVAHDTHNQLKT